MGFVPERGCVLFKSSCHDWEGSLHPYTSVSVSVCMDRVSVSWGLELPLNPGGSV